MSPPILAFDPAWVGYPGVAGIPGTPGWIVVAHELSRTHRAGGSRAEAKVRGFGCGPPGRAVEAAVGELVERFAASDPRVVRGLEVAEPSGERRDGGALHPAGRPFEGGWVRAFGMLEGRPTWIPAAVAVLGYSQRDEVPVDATGLAAGPSFAEAVRRGLGEVIERDAVGLWWRCPDRPHRLISPPEDLAGAAQRAGLAVTAALVESDGCGPVVLACVSRPDGREATLGSAFRDDPAMALAHALAEAFMVRHTVTAHLMTDGARDSLPGVERLVWGWRHGPAILDRLLGPRGSLSPTFDGALATRAHRAFGDEPLGVPLAEVSLGPRRLHVARVVAPGSFRLESRLGGIPHAGWRLTALGGRAGGPHPFG
jgi:hypothetical protein